jgi:hypothetical protein
MSRRARRGGDWRTFVGAVALTKVVILLPVRVFLRDLHQFAA